MEINNSKRLHRYSLPIVLGVVAFLLVCTALIIRQSENNKISRGLFTPVIQVKHSSNGLGNLNQAFGAGGESRTP